jgi:hypothetical protein
MDVVLNWVAQGVVVALAAAAALRVMPVSPAQARYTVVWGAYLLVLVLPAVPALAALVVDAPSVDLAPSAADIVVTIPANWWTSPAAALGFWLIWACVHTVRLAWGRAGPTRSGAGVVNVLLTRWRSCRIGARSVAAAVPRR